MENIIDIYDLEGNKFKVEVLDVFTVDGYEDKNYVVYTRNVEVDKDNVEIYVSILEQNGDKYNFATIEDESEWEAVQAAMKEEGFLDGK